MNIIMLVMRELMSLIPSQSLAVFILCDEYSKGIQGIEEASKGSLWH